MLRVTEAGEITGDYKKSLEEFERSRAEIHLANLSKSRAQELETARAVSARPIKVKPKEEEPQAPKRKISVKKKKNFDEARFLALYEQGASDPEVARIMGVKTNYVYRYRHVLNLPSQTERQRRRLDEDVFMTLYNEGKTDGEAAKIMGASLSAVRSLRVELGLESKWALAHRTK